METRDRRANQVRKAIKDQWARQARPAIRVNGVPLDQTEHPVPTAHPERTATLALLDLMAVRAHLARRAIRVQSVNRVRQAMLAQMERQARRDP
jgi:hypothetical protein